MSLFVGADFGTDGVRVAAYCSQQNRLIADSAFPYPTSYPRPGWAEQDPNAWWAAFGSAMKDLLTKLGGERISTLTVATTASTVVVATEDGVPLRPAIVWMDARAHEEAKRTGDITHPVLEYSGGADAAEWLVPKAMWLAENEPECYRRAQRITEAVDFINYKLTGLWVGSQLNATCKWNFDPERASLVPELFEAFGVPELLEKLPHPIVPVGHPVGTVTPLAAAELGVGTDVMVLQGGIDAHMAMLGAGTTGEGELLITGGTSVALLTHSLAQLPLRGVWGPYPSALIADRWLIEAGQVSGGSILNWLAHTLFGLDAAQHQALIEETSALAPTGTGLLTLDYWMGNRTPYRDPNLRGAILGLSLGHSRASLYRSAVEALALGTKNSVDALERQGLAIDRVVVTGGIRNNPLWLQTLVDVLGKPAELATESNLTLLAGGVTGLFATGEYASLEEASKHVTSHARMVEPRIDLHDAYQHLLSLYRQATDALRPTLHALAGSEDLSDV